MTIMFLLHLNILELYILLLKYPILLSTCEIFRSKRFFDVSRLFGVQASFVLRPIYSDSNIYSLKRPG